jgi:uncharacterized protein YvpB
MCHWRVLGVMGGVILAGAWRKCITILVLLSCICSTNQDSLATDAGKNAAFVNVPIYVQQRNLSCESASLVMAMGVYNVWVSEWTIGQLVPLSDNPNWGYRGNIDGWWGNTTDYGVYADPLVEPLAELGFRSSVIAAKDDPAALKRYLANGVPVVLWLGYWGDQSYTEYTEDGTPYRLNPGYHVVVASGYDESGVYAIDPATGAEVSWAWPDFMWMWNAMEGMGLAIWPDPYMPQTAVPNAWSAADTDGWQSAIMLSDAPSS